MTLPPGVVWVCLAVFLGGCAGLPTDYPRPRSEAMHHTDDTRIGRGVAPLLVVQPGKSGFFTLGNGLDAFVARLALAEAADRILDVEYYLFHDDVTGRLLTGHLLRAADRGVRVRLPLDDMDMGERMRALRPSLSIRISRSVSSIRSRRGACAC